MRKIDPSKSYGPDKIPPKIVKMCADILDGTFASIINDMVSKNRFPTNAKNANVPPNMTDQIKSITGQLVY